MIVLASQSPRRKEILRKILGNDDFLTVPSSFDERTIRDDDCYSLCLTLSERKASSVSLLYPKDFVVGSDTMVLFRGEELGKPKDRDDAFRMLSSLQGSVHKVITSYSILKNSKVLKQKTTEASLYIYPMSVSRINEYIDTGSPFDKAGAYGIQDVEYISSEIVSGDRYIIMGLPYGQLKDDLAKVGAIPSLHNQKRPR